LRFAVIGQLLAAPPPKGELHRALEALAAREWPHPITGRAVRFGVSTLERWLSKARKENRDPVGVLRRKVRTDVGAQASLSLAIREALRAQYTGHMSWSVALHHANLRALAEQRPQLGPIPSYSTIRRYLKSQGLHKRRRLSARRSVGVERAEARLMQREVRSYEAEYVGSLWRMRSPVICGVSIGRDGKSASPVELNSAYLRASEHCNQRVGGLEPSGS
jgi:hypothetical protein